MKEIAEYITSIGLLGNALSIAILLRVLQMDDQAIPTKRKRLSLILALNMLVSLPPCNSPEELGIAPPNTSERQA